MTPELEPLAAVVRAAEGPYFVAVISEAGVHWHSGSQEACECTAGLLNGAPQPESDPLSRAAAVEWPIAAGLPYVVPPVMESPAKVMTREEFLALLEGV